MIRDIKFRAWDKKNQIMNNVEEMIFYKIGDSVSHINPDDNKFKNSIENFELMQYTGLKDKNGKEIYEGDLLMWKGDDGVYFEVFYHQHFARFACNSHYQPGRCGGYIPEVFHAEMEVIGNIHENPELIDASEVESKQ